MKPELNNSVEAQTHESITTLIKEIQYLTQMLSIMSGKRPLFTYDGLLPNEIDTSHDAVDFMKYIYQHGMKSIDIGEELNGYISYILAFPYIPREEEITQSIDAFNNAYKEFGTVVSSNMPIWEQHVRGAIANVFCSLREFTIAINKRANNERTTSNPREKRPTTTQRTIFDYMLLENQEQKQKLLETLHTLIDGKKGKDIALVILVCINQGLMQKPTHIILTETFGDIGVKSGYNTAYSKGLENYLPQEINGIETKLKPFINGL